MEIKDLTVDIVIPVFNEAAVLEKNITILKNHLLQESNFKWRIIIADNGSTDRTSEIVKKLSNENSKILYLHIPAKGRGMALRVAWSKSNADIVSYMDVDLSTNIRYFRLLVEGIKCGYDIAIGSRLMGASRIKRGFRRSIISWIYNLIVKLLFFNGFSDAQCGFKAAKTDVAKRLLPKIKNNNWFFDTELLLLAERCKYRIFEVPVEWIDDLRKTKVHIAKTVFEDLSGLLRMRFLIRRILRK